MEGLVEASPREVIVAATIAHKHRVYLHRRKRNRKSHRRTYGTCQVATAKLHSAMLRHIGCNASEGYHQPIEVAFGTRRGLRKEGVESKVYLRGVHHRTWKDNTMA